MTQCNLWIRWDGKEVDIKILPKLWKSTEEQCLLALITACKPQKCRHLVLQSKLSYTLIILSYLETKPVCPLQRCKQSSASRCDAIVTEASKVTCPWHVGDIRVFDWRRRVTSAVRVPRKRSEPIMGTSRTEIHEHRTLFVAGMCSASCWFQVQPVVDLGPPPAAESPHHPESSQRAPRNIGRKTPGPADLSVSQCSPQLFPKSPPSSCPFSIFFTWAANSTLSQAVSPLFIISAWVLCWNVVPK